MSQLLKLGWEYIPNIITEVEAIQIKYQNLLGAINDLNSLKGKYDPQRGRVLFCYAPPSCAYIMHKTKPILENLIQEELIPTYWFCTTYHNKGFMTCHTDRPSCEISITMNICGNAKWPIKLKDKSGKIISKITPPGCGVAYLGTEIPHWRSPLRTSENDRYMQLFLHFIRKNGKNREYAYDKNQRCYDLLNNFKE